MLQIVSETLELQPDGKVLKADQYQSYLDAEQVVARAKEEAERILAAAREQYEDQKRQGYEDGVLEAKAVMAEEMIESVGQSVEYLGAIERQVADIVIQVLEKMIGQTGSADLVVGAARTALDVVRNQTHVTLRVCPEQLPIVRERVGEILNGHPAVSFLDVQPDARLKADGCILESEIGVIDASIEVQLEAINKAIRNSISSVKE